MRPKWPPTTSQFLSTLPARGATQKRLFVCQRQVFLSTLPARGATSSAKLPLSGSRKISIHAPREGSDQSRCRRRRLLQISIHAPREGSDPAPPLPEGLFPNFYPRSPRGERLALTVGQPKSSEFLSTLPARGATVLEITLNREFYISIHAPREGSDPKPRL